MKNKISLWSARILIVSFLYSGITVSHVSPAVAASTFVQSANSSGTTTAVTTISATLAAVPTAGDLLVAIVGNRDAYAGTPTVTSSTGWTTAVSQQNNSPGQMVFYKISTGAVDQTVTIGTYPSTRLGLQVFQFSATNGWDPSPLDQVGTNSGTGTALSSGTVTTTTSREVILAGFVSNSNSNPASWGAVTGGFTMINGTHTWRSNAGGGGQTSFGGAYQSVGSVGTYTATTTTSASGAWRGNAISFKERVASLTQGSYRWFSNTGTTSITTPLASQNSPATLSSTGQQFRLRMLIDVSVVSLPLGEGIFALQYAGKGTGTCAAPSGGTPATYTDVTAATSISFFNNPTPTDGDAVVPNGALDPSDGTQVAQTYEELNPFSNTATIPVNQNGLWDFSLYDNGAPASTAYCFRAVRNDGLSLNAYSQYPELTTYGLLSLTLSSSTFDFGTVDPFSPSYSPVGYEQSITIGTSSGPWTLSVQGPDFVSGSYSAPIGRLSASGTCTGPCVGSAGPVATGPVLVATGPASPSTTVNVDLILSTSWADAASGASYVTTLTYTLIAP